MEDFFSKYGITIGSDSNAEIGKTYPIFGMITDVLENEEGEIIAEINFSIKARMNLSDSKKVELLKERAFEPGIFVSTVLSKDLDKTLVDCQTVVFGKKTEYSA